jgi:hypothetical protein
MMGLVVPATKWSAVNKLFSDRLRGLQGNPETIAYIVGVLSKRRWDEDDLSNQSVVLAFHDAGLKGDFATFQRIGDWVLFIDTVFPEHFNGVRECVENIGRLSYYRCFRLMGGKWHVYEELADELPSLAVKVRHRLV